MTTRLENLEILEMSGNLQRVKILEMLGNCQKIVGPCADFVVKIPPLFNICRDNFFVHHQIFVVTTIFAHKILSRSLEIAENNVRKKSWK